jgi:hypothetical protein
LSGNIFVDGITDGSLLGPQYGSHGITDTFAAEFSPSGVLQRSNQLGQAREKIFATNLNLDKSENKIIACVTSAILTSEIKEHGVSDIFIAKFNLNTSLQEIIQIGKTDYSLTEEEFEVTKGGFLITGKMHGDIFNKSRKFLATIVNKFTLFRICNKNNTTILIFKLNGIACIIPFNH